jgi:DNA polymerase-3 subunit delta'
LVEAFRRVVSSGRLAHAYLFTGPPGVGKRLFAVELAKALLCEHPQAAARLDACDECPACLQVAAEVHPDFQRFGLPEEAHEIPVALIREAANHLALRPARGRYRVLILDDADHLSDAAANAFLKTLEEPPPASLLTLIGTSPDRQLPTIVSRCQVIRFSPLPADVLAGHLISEGRVEDPAEAARLARLGGGSLSRAQALADPELLKFRTEWLQDLAQPRHDSVAWAGRLVQIVEGAGKESAARRERANLLLGFLVEFLRAALVLQQGGDVPQLEAAEARAARTLADRLPAERLLAALERSLEATMHVDRRVQLVLALEALADATGQLLRPA